MEIDISNASAGLAAGVIQRLLGRAQECEFRPIGLVNGLCLQLHSYMLRAATTNCQFDSEQIVLLALASCKYDRGYFHITTRQTVQFNWISLAGAAKLTQLLSRAGLSSLHTSGNCVRQITCDPLWGISLDETTDATGFISTLKQQTVLNPAMELLPKKVKMCVWSAYNDRVLGQFNDIGIKLTADSGFVTLGGGLGRAPAAGVRLIKMRAHLLTQWVLAFLRVYNALASTGKYSLRTKFLVRKLGKLALFKLTSCELNSSARAIAILPARASEVRLKCVHVIRWLNSHKFEHWYSKCTWSQRVLGARWVLVGTNAPPGDITAASAIALATLTQRYCMDQIRLTLAQTLILPWMPTANAVDVFATCSRYPPHSVVCCPGLDYCALASARSIVLASKLMLLKTTLNIRVSGCANACSQHHVFDIGIVGVPKANAEAYQVFVCGNTRAGRIAKPISKAAPAHKIITLVHRYCALVRLLQKDSSESAYACCLRVNVSLRNQC
ncbi:Sulfite reductase [NADPH] hemoprotein beta-component [Candidatus Hodgkinia cicadicola]|nr:Sulfite reductase [NADPH] hemoprotein beta-component [Candidatus Hodgkinia cicadicola]